LLFAARFPGKVAKLVLAGAPIDVTAGDSGLSALAASSPLEVFHELVSIGDGRVLGRAMLQFWGSGSVETAEIGELLQVPDPVGSPAYAQIERTFRHWYAWTVDLPGQFYLEVIEKLYKQNELPAGRFVALGERVDLKKVQAPLFLLAARDDEVVAPAQLFAAKRLVGTTADNIETDTVDCRHIGLFMGRAALHGPWPKIARWILASEDVVPPLAGTDAGDTDESGASRAPARAPL
jgi:poly(3-hydroxybutyrate) depolymerase